MGSKGHSSIGASSAHRWFECPGSVQLILHAPPQESSVYAARGTAAHMVLEECLMTDKDPWDYEGFDYESGELNEEDIEAVVEAMDFLEEKMNWVEKNYGSCKILKEAEVELKRIHPKLWSTLDIVIYTVDFTYIGVFDYKHGSGVTVSVEGNVQLLIYLLGAINKLAPELIGTLGWGHVFKYMEIGIIQPRVGEITDPVAINWDELDGFVMHLTTMAVWTDQKDAPFKAGSHCRWCPAKPICPQLYNQTTQLAQADFSVVEPKPKVPTALTNEQIGRVLDNEDIITGWVKAVKSLAQQKLERGEDIPGFKLVKKKANRVWKDLRDIEVMLAQTGIEMWDKKVKSPAQIEKLLPKSKDSLADYITKPDNGNTIAKESDRRKPVPASIETDFKVITKGKEND